MKLSNLKKTAVDTKVVNSGSWEKLGDPFGDVEIFTRGTTDTYQDALTSRLRKAAVPYRNNIQAIPIAIFRAIRTECMIEYLWGDVRGLTEDDEKTPVTWEKFCDEYLRQPTVYPELLDACIAATERVGRADLALADAAKGN